MRHLIASILAAVVITIWFRPLCATTRARRPFAERPSTPPPSEGRTSAQRRDVTAPGNLPSSDLDAWRLEVRPTAPAAKERAPAPRDFWCECLIADIATAQTWPLRSYHALHADEAMQWLQHQAARLAQFIDPTPGQGAVPAKALRRLDDFLDAADEPDPATAFRMWPTDIAERDQARQAMQYGTSYTFSVADRRTRYCMSVRPTFTAGPLLASVAAWEETA